MIICVFVAVELGKQRKKENPWYYQVLPRNNNFNKIFSVIQLTNFFSFLHIYGSRTRHWIHVVLSLVYPVPSDNETETPRHLRPLAAWNPARARSASLLSFLCFERFLFTTKLLTFRNPFSRLCGLLLCFIIQNAPFIISYRSNLKS